MTNREKEENYAIRIREEYSPKGESDIDALRKLDKRVKRPAEAFAWTFGVLGALVLGVGMCLAMEVIGSIMPLGVVVGVVGTLIFGTGMCMVMEWALYAEGVVVSVIGAAACACAYPLYKRILRRGREKHAEEILRLGDELLGGKERSEKDDAHADADGGDD